jgi:hypothetical protein
MSFDTIEAIIGGVAICLMVATQLMYMLDELNLAYCLGLDGLY